MLWTGDVVQHTVTLLLKKAKPEGNMRKMLNIYRPSTMVMSSGCQPNARGWIQAAGMSSLLYGSWASP